MNAMGMSWLVLVFAAMFSGGEREVRQAPAQEAQQAFETVMRHVEPGGDALLVLNTENAVKGLAASASELVTALTEGKTDKDAVTARRVAGELPAFLDRNGFLALRAFGYSSVPEGNGTHRSRCFLLRAPGAENSPLWRGLVGGTPRQLASHTYWSEDVAWAVSGTGEAAELWKVLRSVVNELIPEARADFEKGLAEAGAELGVDVEALIASLGDEAFFALLLDDSTQFTVPDLNVPVPTPAVLLGVRLREPLLARRLEAALKELEAQMPLVRTTVGDTTLTSVPVPVPLPFAVQPTLAYRAADGMLLLGSSTAAVREAVETAASGQRRLLDSKEFAEAFGGKAPDNNGIAYFGRRLSTVLGSVQRAAIEKMAAEGGDAEGAALLRRMQALMGDKAFHTTVVVNGPEGTQFLSRGTAGPERYVQAGLVAPIGLFAGLTLPAFAKARQSAQRAACVNNLRMLDAAKEQWALANNKQDGDVVDAAAAAEYLKGGLPVCPKHKTPYRLNAIGTDPECASGDPQHVLP